MGGCAVLRDAVVGEVEEVGKEGEVEAITLGGVIWDTSKIRMRTNAHRGSGCGIGQERGLEC